MLLAVWADRIGGSGQNDTIEDHRSAGSMLFTAAPGPPSQTHCCPERL